MCEIGRRRPRTSTTEASRRRIAVYWTTSDVWNQSTNVASAPGPDGYVRGDPPKPRRLELRLRARVAPRPRRGVSAQCHRQGQLLHDVFWLRGDQYPARLRDRDLRPKRHDADDARARLEHPGWFAVASQPRLEIDAPDGDDFSQPSLAKRLENSHRPFHAR